MWGSVKDSELNVGVISIADRVGACSSFGDKVTERMFCVFWLSITRWHWYWSVVRVIWRPELGQWGNLRRP